MNDVTITGDCRRNNLVTVFKLGLKQAVEEFDFDVFILCFFSLAIKGTEKINREMHDKVNNLIKIKFLPCNEIHAWNIFD